jgi:hypothetical protein
MKKNWLVTVGGIMAGCLSVPIGAATMGYPLPKTMAMILIVVGLIGAVVTGVAAKGQDEHSTEAQVQTSTIQNPKVEAAAKVAAIEAPVPAPVVPIVPKPPEVKP